MPETTDDPTAVLADPTPPPMPPTATAFDNLTVLDWFAGQALTGLLAFSPPDAAQYVAADAAGHAYDIAAAMMKKRSKFTA